MTEVWCTKVFSTIIRELKQHITSLTITLLTITSQSLHHHFLCLFIYLGFLAGIVLLSNEFTQPTGQDVPFQPRYF